MTIGRQALDLLRQHFGDETCLRPDRGYRPLDRVVGSDIHHMDFDGRLSV